MQKVAFIINRTISKFVKRKNEIETVFNSTDFETKFFVSEKCRHIENLAQNALSEGFDYLIFVGGDGTINEGLNGVMSFFKNNENEDLSAYNFEHAKKIKIGLLPYGSGNDFAKTIQISKDINQLKDKILANKTQLVDIGFAQFLDENKKPSSRFYMNITDVGMGGIIANKIIDKNNAFNADLIYIKAIFTTLLNYKKNKKHHYTFLKNLNEIKATTKPLVFLDSLIDLFRAAMIYRVTKGDTAMVKLEHIGITDEEVKKLVELAPEKFQSKNLIKFLETFEQSRHATYPWIYIESLLISE